LQFLASFLFVFPCSRLLTMSDVSETNSAILTRLFKDPDAILGQKWLDSVNSGWTEASLHHLVVASGTLTAPKTKDLYGHFRTKTQMKGLVGPHWMPDPLPFVQDETKRLNTTTVDSQQRLQQLRTDKIGGFLVVTRIVSDSGPGTPFLTVLAAPSVVTFNSTTGDAGVTLDDLWDTSVLANFQPHLQPAELHCPIIGAQEGFSRSSKTEAKVFSLLQDSQPLLLPNGELTCTTVLHDVTTLPRTIFLPEVCNLPIGMRWPVTIGLKDFLSSIQGAYGQAGGIFITALSALEPALSLWFMAIAADWSSFVIPACPFLPTYDVAYPALESGVYPETILDQEGFSPMLDMLYGHVWRLWCDRILTTDTKLNRQHMNTYLNLGAPAITADTYLGTAIPGRFCPNYAYHFTVVNGWPTDKDDQRFLGEFQHLPLISHQARQYDPIPVDLHQPDVTVPPLCTREERASASHQSRTPKFSYPRPTPVNLLTPSKQTPLVTTPQRQVDIPSSTKAFSPSPLAPHRAPRMATGSAQRRLEEDMREPLQAPRPPAIPSSDALAVPVKLLRYDPLTATVNTPEGRSVATDIFLNTCRLLAHHSKRRQLQVGTDPILPESLIYVREPCNLFRREILNHLAKYTSHSTYMPPFSSFLEAILRPVQIYVNGVFDLNFFTGSFLHAFLSVESWMVNAHILPANVPPATFHVYSLIACLPAHSGHSLRLPPNGLTLLEAKHLGILTYYLFAMMDLTDGSFSDEKFVTSILGQRLKAWSSLPDSATIHGLWNQAPLQATYQWFASLQSLLCTIQLWVKRLRYHPERGFYHARDKSGHRYLLLDSQVPSNIPGRTDSLIEALGHFDHAFETRWFRSSFMDPIWTTPLPPGHCLPPPNHGRHSQSHTRDAYHRPDDGRTSRHDDRRAPRQDDGRNPRYDDGQHKRAKLGGERIKNPDFINRCPLMECTSTIPLSKSVLQHLYGKFQMPVSYPRFPTSTGTWQTLCLNSSFVGPHNTCSTRMCGDRKAVPPMSRLHIDLSRETWRSQPEAYWAPLVTFLLNPEVLPHIRPTPTLKKLTPSTKWQ
jgi:hypothetical protein